MCYNALQKDKTYIMTQISSKHKDCVYLFCLKTIGLYPLSGKAEHKLTCSLSDLFDTYNILYHCFQLSLLVFAANKLRNKVMTHMIFDKYARFLCLNLSFSILNIMIIDMLEKPSAYAFLWHADIRAHTYKHMKILGNHRETYI